MMEYVLPNIIEAAKFDKTAEAIILVGFKKTVASFFSKISILDNGCWINHRKPTEQGYRKHRMTKICRGVNFDASAHRVSWLMSGMKLENGLVLDHKCKNRGCLNPFHLRNVSQWVNSTENSVSPFAINKQKNQCVRGHLFSEKNTIIRKDRSGKPTWRGCRKCRTDYLKKYWLEYKKREVFKK